MLNVKRVSMSRVQFDELERLQVKKRLDCPAVFSTNPAGSIWPFVRFSRTPERERENVRGQSEPLDCIANHLRRIRRGGCFFITDEGAFYKEDYGDYGEPVPFTRFEITG